MIELKDVWKTYKSGSEVVHALRGINLNISEGDFMFLIGPSGSGKTTLLDTLGALNKPTKGEIIIDGTSLSKLTDEELCYFRRRKLGFVFQSFNLIPSLNCIENVVMPLIPEGVKPEDYEKAKKLLEGVGLGHRLTHKPNELSGGEKQRVAIARAFINDPVMVLADEPTGNLDSKTGEQIFEYMRKMNKEKNTTFIIVTHDTEFIQPGNEVFRIKDGQCESNTKHCKIKIK